MIKNLVCFICVLCIINCSKNTSEIKIFTGPQGGAWYPIGGSFKKFIENDSDIKVKVFPGAGISNIIAVEQKKADFAITNSVSTFAAINGIEPFKKEYNNICNLITLYPQYFQIISTDLNINDISDFKDKSFTGQKYGSTAEEVTRLILKFNSLTYDDFAKVNYGSYTDSVTLLKDKHAQIFSLGTTIPASSITEIASSLSYKFINISDFDIKRLHEYNQGFLETTIPANTYKSQVKKVKTVGYFTHVICRCDENEENVALFLNSIKKNINQLRNFSNSMENLNLKTLSKELFIPTHKIVESELK